MSDRQEHAVQMTGPTCELCGAGLMDSGSRRICPRCHMTLCPECEERHRLCCHEIARLRQTNREMNRRWQAAYGAIQRRRVFEFAMRHLERTESRRESAEVARWKKIASKQGETNARLKRENTQLRAELRRLQEQRAAANQRQNHD